MRKKRKKISDAEKWRKLLSNLRKHYSVSCPVKVRRMPLLKNQGVVRFDGVQFQIRISSNEKHNHQRESLIHEWTHVVAIDLAYTHNQTWGGIYSSIYTDWINDFRKIVK